MKKWILAITMCLVLTSLVNAQGKDPNDGLSVWLMGQNNLTQTDAAYNLRVGYKMGLIEPFAGIEIRPSSKPEIFNVGFLIHSGDIVEPNAIPWLSNLLLPILNSEMVVTGYTGAHSTLNVHNKGNYFGSIVGIEAKDKPESPVSINAEVHFNDIGGGSELDQAGISETTYFLGLCWRF